MRTIRIVYIDAFKRTVSDYPPKPRQVFLDVADPSTTLELRAAPDAFVEFVEQTYEAELTAVQGAREAWKVEQQGNVDAICIDCNVEPGVKAARELCDTLVMGPACAVQHVASMLGRKFSYVICGREGDVHHVKEALLTASEHYGLSHKLASIREIEINPTGFDESTLSDTEFDKLKQDTLLEAETAISEDGAEVIIAYGGSELYDHLVKNLSHLGVPVLSPDRTLQKVTEMLVRLGLTQSKKTYPKPRQIYDFTIEKTEILSN